MKRYNYLMIQRVNWLDAGYVIFCREIEAPHELRKGMMVSDSIMEARIARVAYNVDDEYFELYLQGQIVRATPLHMLVDYRQKHGWSVVECVWGGEERDPDSLGEEADGE